jgi:hypothetical protein
MKMVVKERECYGGNAGISGDYIGSGFWTIFTISALAHLLHRLILLRPRPERYEVRVCWHAD